MTDEQINKAIAEARGWTEVKKFDCLLGIPPHNAGVFCRVHNYAGCLNAMNGAEEMLSSEQKEKYFVNLVFLCGNWPKAIQATARQKAEAFLKTLGKWEEEA